MSEKERAPRKWNALKLVKRVILFMLLFPWLTFIMGYVLGKGLI